MHSDQSLAKYILFLFFIYFSFSGFIRIKRLRRISELMLESILFCDGLFFIKRESLSSIIISVLFGGLYLILMTTLMNMRDLQKFIYDMTSNRLNHLRVKRAVIFFRQTVIAFWEEVIWRVCYVEIMRQLSVSDMIIAISGSLLFTMTHWSFNYRRRLSEQSEFLLFSFLLYALYLSMGSLVAIWVIHLMRNLIIGYFREFASHAG